MEAVLDTQVVAFVAVFVGALAPLQLKPDLQMEHR